jgi:hypothetical protein
MASGEAFSLGAFPDPALSAMHKSFIGQTASALDIFNEKFFTIRKSALAGNFSLIKIHQPLLEFEIIVAVSYIDGTNSAVKAAGCNKIRIYRHISILQFLKLFIQVGFKALKLRIIPLSKASPRRKPGYRKPEKPGFRLPSE